jgi:hypothetical protein
MGFGISVSVDSWTEQAIASLSAAPHGPGDKIYRRLVASATCPAEILVLEAADVRRLVHSPGDNLVHVISACLEHLGGADVTHRLNAAALLSRLFPFLCAADSPLPFEAYVLTQMRIAGADRLSPGAFIVETALNLLLAFDAAGAAAFLDDAELHVPVFDLLALTVFLLAHYFGNRTLYHQLIVVVQANLARFASVLLNYVALGGRRESLIGVLTLLLFHPSGALAQAQVDFVRAGGALSRRLCALTGEPSDYLCVLCSLATLDDDATPAVWGRDAPLVRLGLAKALYNSAVDVTPAQVVAAWRATASPIARAMMGRFAAPPPDALEKCPPLENPVVVRLHESKAWVERTCDIVAEAYLFIKSYWFTGTGLAQAQPAFTEIDAIVAERAA